MQSSPPISTAHLFPLLDAHLAKVLRSLKPEQWDLPTVAPMWTVKDIAAHLLDSNIRLLSALRDNHMGPAPAKPIPTYRDLVDHLNRMNADWIQAMKRASPAVLIDLLMHTGKSCSAYWAELPLYEPALFSVAWAGESESQNWFHMAREYTEKWHHQQQIRLAVGQEVALYQPELYGPYLETSFRALPHHYRDVSAPEDTLIAFQIMGPAKGNWYLRRGGQTWQLIPPSSDSPTCEVQIPGAIAWRMFTKGISRSEAQAQVQIHGQKSLGTPIFDMLAVMA